MSKKVFALIAVILSMSLLVAVASAQPETMSVWTDKSEYAPGETGTLYIVFYNNRGQTVTIDEITITFESWRAYKSDQWEGNYTISVEDAFMADDVLEEEVSFTVPTDGRAISTNAKVEVDADVNIADKNCMIYVSYTPKHMEQIITLFTILVVLLIVCTIIIAATIFLSARKPQAILRKEERPE